MTAKIKLGRQIAEKDRYLMWMIVKLHVESQRDRIQENEKKKKKKTQILDVSKNISERKGREVKSERLKGTFFLEK